MEDLYLSEEEALEFNKYVNDYFQKYKDNTRNVDGVCKHQCFISLIKIINDK